MVNGKVLLDDADKFEAVQYSFSVFIPPVQARPVVFVNMI